MNDMRMKAWRATRTQEIWWTKITGGFKDNLLIRTDRLYNIGVVLTFLHPVGWLHFDAASGIWSALHSWLDHQDFLRSCCNVDNDTLFLIPLSGDESRLLIVIVRWLNWDTDRTERGAWARPGSIMVLWDSIRLVQWPLIIQPQWPVDTSLTAH